MIPPSAESLFEKFFVKDILRWVCRFSWTGIELRGSRALILAFERSHRVAFIFVTTQVEVGQGSGFGVQERISCPNPIAADPNRQCGRLPKTMAIALVNFLNPEL